MLALDRVAICVKESPTDDECCYVKGELTNRIEKASLLLSTPALTFTQGGAERIDCYSAHGATSRHDHERYIDWTSDEVRGRHPLDVRFEAISDNRLGGDILPIKLTGLGSARCR